MLVEAAKLEWDLGQGRKRSSHIATTVDPPLNRDFGYKSGEGNDDLVTMKENDFGQRLLLLGA